MLSCKNLADVSVRFARIPFRNKCKPRGYFRHPGWQGSGRRLKTDRTLRRPAGPDRSASHNSKLGEAQLVRVLCIKVVILVSHTAKGSVVQCRRVYTAKE